jgi:hypothetical protein
MKKLMTACLSLACLFATAQTAKGKMKPLFNGRDLDGWYSFLRTKGKNNDPENVFSIENNILHISGKEFGYICTEREFTNFHLLVEFKWGVRKYPPRDADTTRRDNGILFHIPAGTKDSVWPKGIECQIQEGDVGDFWMIDSTTIVANGVRSIPKDYFRVQKSKDAEKPTGEWNTIEVIVQNNKIIYIVNETVVNECTDPSVTRGKISIQSEGAEIYYRTIAIEEY